MKRTMINNPRKKHRPLQKSKGGYNNEKRIVKTEVSTDWIYYICDNRGVISAGLDVQYNGLFNGDTVTVYQRSSIVEVTLKESTCDILQVLSYFHSEVRLL